MSSHSVSSRRVIVPVHTALSLGPSLRPRMGRLGIVVLLLVLAAGLFLLWGPGAERRTVSTLPAPQRALAFQEAQHRYRVLCGAEGRAAGLRTECAQQAHFLRLFPECDARCEALTDRDVPGPTR